LANAAATAVEDRPLRQSHIRQDAVHLEWEGSDHTTVLPIPELQRSLSWNSPVQEPIVHPPSSRASLPRFPFLPLCQQDDALLQWLDALAEEGAALVTACPAPPDEEDHAVVALAKRISQPQPTIYGTTFDVVAMPEPINIAYSTVKLDLHQDLIYYESPPGQHGGQGARVKAFTRASCG
jgi:gamma-butyrobetaine dioxygenase